ncbi:MAG: SWIM zinc finger family protein [Planctomycetes bacterium]|nr:SWIM zinc finger family protein [Planctomycetota bacterium]
MSPLTLDQIVALAPDAASAKAGRELASARRWTLLATDGELLWGLAQGSGASPYQVQVLPAEPAYRCTCPSRKFPCKHVLALLLLSLESPTSIESAARPEWVREWIASRAERAEKQRARTEPEYATPTPDLAARAKRRETRAKRSDEGVALLRQFLLDLVRSGLADPSVRTDEPWTQIARRMIDAQVPGFAARLRRIQELLAAGTREELRAFDEIGRLHVLARAFERRAELETPLAASVLAQAGWTTPSEELLRESGVTDTWFAAGRTVTEHDRLITTTTWLVGTSSRRHAYSSTAEPVHLPRSTSLALGAGHRGELVFHPGPTPLRALFRTSPAPGEAEWPSPEPLRRTLERHARAVQQEPWFRSTPFLAELAPAELRGRCVLVDPESAALPWRVRPRARELLEALGGGRALLTFGLWDGEAIELLAVGAAGEWLDLAGAVA